MEKTAHRSTTKLTKNDGKMVQNSKREVERAMRKR